MRRKVSLSRDGNSWSIRIPKAILRLSAIKPGAALRMEAKRGRIIVYPVSQPSYEDDYKNARQVAKQTWDEAFEDMWFELFGIDE